MQLPNTEKFHRAGSFRMNEGSVKRTWEKARGQITSGLTSHTEGSLDRLSHFPDGSMAARAPLLGFLVSKKGLS